MLITDILARNVARRGTHPFVRHPNGEVTFGTFERLSNQAANALLALGVKAGDRVTVAVGNSKRTSSTRSSWSTTSARTASRMRRPLVSGCASAVTRRACRASRR